MKAIAIHAVASILFLAAFLASPLTASIHIKSDGSGDFPTIQAGISAAAWGDTVLLAEGIYTGVGNYNIYFDGKAIMVNSENGPVTTIVDCQGLGCGFIFGADEAHDSILSGLTIRNGNFAMGGGIYCWYSSPTISNNIIIGNSGSLGGGICIDGTEEHHPVIANNIIGGNYAANGGGICCIGAAPTISGNTISGNAANDGGGGLCLLGASADVKNAIIAFSATGAGVLCEGGNSRFTNCDIFGNAGGDVLCGSDGGGNISADPLYCGILGSGNYNLQSISPCAPGNHSSGALVGACPVGCGASGVSPNPVPLVLVLLQNRPNPFNPLTTLRFDLPAGGRVRLGVYDVAGRLIRTLLDADLPTGSHQAFWDGTDSAGRGMPSGSYCARLLVGEAVKTVRMSLIR